MIRILRENPICAILRHMPLEQTIPYAKAIYRGGIHMFEVATNSEMAYEQIRLLRKEFGETAWIGAGTVVNRERCEKAEEAGAQFFLTPSANCDTIKFCIDRHIPILPGVMTPTDVDVCLSYGIRTMKLFPAGQLTAGYIKSLKGPFDQTEYVAVGGVSERNIKSFFEQGFIGVGIGGCLIPEEMVRNQDWESAETHVRNLVKLSGVRNVK